MTTRRLKKDKKTQKCTKVCVAWGYRRKLSSTLLSTSSFHDANQARAGCGANYQVGAPPGGFGGNTFRMNSNTLFIGSGKKWSLNSAQVGKLPIDKAMPVPSNTNKKLATTQPPSSYSSTNVIIQSNKLHTCQPGSQNMGCVEISFTMAVPKTAMALGMVTKTGSGGRAFDVDGWQAPGYWLCSGEGTYSNINAFCPGSSGSLSKGITSCGEPDLNSKTDAAKELMASLRSANKFKTWAFRLLGFIMFFCTVSSCLQPIKSVLGFITNMMDAGTDCIPCVGSCVDFLTDIFMSVVKIILFIVAFCCGGACFLTVVMIMWIVMRPVLGCFLLVVVCCCYGGAGYLLHMNRSGKSAREVNLGAQSEMADAGSFQG